MYFESACFVSSEITREGKCAEKATSAFRDRRNVVGSRRRAIRMYLARPFVRTYDCSVRNRFRTDIEKATETFSTRGLFVETRRTIGGNKTLLGYLLSIYYVLSMLCIISVHFFNFLHLSISLEISRIRKCLKCIAYPFLPRQLFVSYEKLSECSPLWSNLEKRSSRSG